MQCKACGQENDPGLRYCVACGHGLTGEHEAVLSSSGDSLLPAGTVLKSTYEIVRLLGEGGAGAVYEARHVALGHPVAIKVLFGQLARLQQIRHRFLEEGRIQANLRHPNIVRVHDVVDDGQIVAIVMEFVEGETLHDYIQRQRKLIPVTRAGQIVLKLLAGLGAAHAQEIVHRDIKPGNVMLAMTEQGIVPKLCDFGIAKVASAQRRTVTGTKMGTLHYMAPEQFQDAARVDRRADIYALGVTFFELLTRQMPFDTDNDYQLMRAHIEVAPPSPRGMRPDLSVGLSDLVLKALAKRPEERFQSCPEMAHALVSLSELRSFEGVASLPGVPVSDDLVPPPATIHRATRAPGTPPTRHSGPGPSPFERARPERNRAPGDGAPATIAREDVPPRRARGIGWFPLFLGAFAALLVALVLVWIATRETPSLSVAAAPADPLGGLKTDERDPGDAGATGQFEGGDAAAATPGAESAQVAEGSTGASAADAGHATVWSVDTCEALAESVADLEALHTLDDAAVAELLVGLGDAEEACRDLLVPPEARDTFLIRLGQTQQARLRIARAVLGARAAGEESEAACGHILVARRAIERMLRLLQGTAQDPELHPSLREPIGELGQSVLSGRLVLDRRYLHCP